MTLLPPDLMRTRFRLNCIFTLLFIPCDLFVDSLLSQVEVGLLSFNVGSVFYEQPPPLTGAEIAGIVIGCLIFVGVMIAVALLLRRYQVKRQRELQRAAMSGFQLVDFREFVLTSSALIQLLRYQVFRSHHIDPTGHDLKVCITLSPSLEKRHAAIDSQFLHMIIVQTTIESSFNSCPLSSLFSS